MGLIISRFRKKTSTKDQLEQIQKDVAAIKEYRQHTQQRQKRLVGCLVLYSILLYLVAAIVCYFYYFPSSLQHQLLYATPFIIFPFLVYFFKRLLTWHYRGKISKNEEKLKELHQRQENILEQVMETETYKVAKEILEKYAPNQISCNQLQMHKGSLGVVNQQMPTPSSTPAHHPDVRRRLVGTPQTGGGGAPGIRAGVPSGLLHQTPAFIPRPILTAQSAPVRPIVGGGVRSVAATPGLLGLATPQVPSSTSIAATPLTQFHTPHPCVGGPPGPPMPRPVLPRERGVMDRFIEYLVGDGPANRFALVCRQCESHNGMALKDEFQYLAFRCAYCFYWNPARKQRPAAPRLETVAPSLPPSQDQEEDEDDQESSSGEEEEEEEDGEEEESESNNSSGDDDEEEEDDEEGVVSSEVSSAQATSSQEGSLEVLAKSTPSSGPTTTTSSDQTTTSDQTTSSDQTSDDRQKESESSPLEAPSTGLVTSSTTPSSTTETE